MASDRTGVDVERELRLLAEADRTPDTDLSASVLLAIAGAPVPRRQSAPAAAATRAAGWLRARWRALTLLVFGVVIVGGAATPVGAAVARWFTFGGVEVVQGPTAPEASGTVGSAVPTPAPSSSPPATSTTTSVGLAPPTRRSSPGPATQQTGGTVALSGAAQQVGFTPLLPAGLPAPDRITVQDGRVVTMTWTDLGLRLDQFRGEASPVFIKKVANEIQFVDVGSDQGLWFDSPHELVFLDADGNERADSERIAGRTLLWTHGPLTLRLEGAGSSSSAVDIAETVG